MKYMYMNVTLTRGINFISYCGAGEFWCDIDFVQLWHVCIIATVAKYRLHTKGEVAQ